MLNFLPGSDGNDRQKHPHCHYLLYFLKIKITQIVNILAEYFTNFH